MEAKDIIAIAGIGSTLVVSSVTLWYSVWSNKRTSFVNTVTTSRLKWIDSLRDEVAEFIAVTASLTTPRSAPNGENVTALCLQRDTLLHQIVLHLNPHDTEDQRIKTMVDHVRDLTKPSETSMELSKALLELRNVTAAYLKKEWNRVKQESGGRT